MNLTRGTRALLVALTVAASALVAPAMALAETPADDDPIGPVDVANPTENPDPDPDDDPIGPDDVANPTENPDPDPCDEPTDGCCLQADDECEGGEDPGDPGDDSGTGDAVPEADVDEPVLANPTFTG
jgi:hypothetical protein